MTDRAFSSNGVTASGYLVTLPGRLALAPDLYHGEFAGHDEMDNAAELVHRLLMSERDMGGPGG